MKRIKNGTLVVALTSLVLLTGCIKPYKERKFITIAPSQTAFLIPLEGNSKGNQASFDSLEFLQEAKVAAKRIEINRRWHQTGRREYTGQYIDTERLIIVERKPETREWTADPNSGTSAKNEGIETESKGSIGFVVGIGITAQIDEPDAVRFLYRYNNKPLSNILDEEIRNMIESKFNEECSKRDLKTIMSSKANILTNVKESVIPYFRERGITITNLGYKGQFTYTDSKIQDAINNEFIAEKKAAAQEKLNQMEVKKAQAEADAIRKRAETLDKQIKLKELQVQLLLAEKWNGQLPNVMSSENGGMILQMLDKN